MSKDKDSVTVPVTFQRYDEFHPSQNYLEMKVYHETHINLEIMQSIRKKLTKYAYKPYVMGDGRILDVTDKGKVIITAGGNYNEKLDEFDSDHTKSIRKIAAWENNSNKVHIVTASSDGTARIFDFDGNFVKQLNHGASITSLLVSPGDETYLDALVITGASDGTIKVWGIKTGKARFTLKGHSRLISDLCFTESRQGDLLLASIDHRGEIRLWDLATGELKRELGYFETNQREVQQVLDHKAEQKRLDTIAKEKARIDKENEIEF